MNSDVQSRLGLARTIHALLSHPSDPQLTEATYALSQLGGELEHLKQVQARLAICRQRSWHLAGQRLLGDLGCRLHDLGAALARCQRAVNQNPEQIPTLRLVYDELVQAEEEFSSFEYRPDDHVLVVTTQPLVLEGVFLGRFEIRLTLDPRGASEPQERLRIVALDPNPAAADERVTHPHVSDERLCAGEASAALRTALQAGRICDVFLLVRSVLENYNADSPFVSLDNWEGTPCEDCGSIISADDAFLCERCQHEFCAECISYCRSCDSTLCRGCLRTCPACDESTCAGCLQACRICGQKACASCLVDGRCGTCIEKEKHHDQKANPQQEPARQGAGQSIRGRTRRRRTASRPEAA